MQSEKRFQPAYLDLEPEALKARAAEAREILEDCRLCPRECGVNRAAGEKGSCGVGRLPLVSSVGPHFGEEPPLVGRHGSGTIFFAGCNLQCIFCQNYDISQLRQGSPVSPEKLARSMLALEERGCHNINFVSPSHVVAQILEALVIAVEEGLALPLVYNSGGYDALSTLALCDGVFDIYMPDMKYAAPETALKYSGVPSYPEVNRKALSEMHRQVGPLQEDERGIAQRGLLIRHLVMPEGLAGSEEVLDFVAEHLGPDTYVNIMAQYHPSYQAYDHLSLSRRISRQEYARVLEYAEKIGLSRGFPRPGMLL